MGNKNSLLTKETPSSASAVKSDNALIKGSRIMSLPQNGVQVETSQDLSASKSKSHNDVSSDHKTENSKSESKTESFVINEQAAEQWQPQYYHMMRPDARLDNLRRFHSIEDSLYPLPADIQEQDRLEIQHNVAIYCFGGLFLMPIKDVLSQPGSKVLDVGCGPGSWSRDVATAYPNCEVHAIVNIDPDNYFDGVFQRFLIAGIPKDKWDDAIRELLRVTKPGGFIECDEPDMRIFRLGPNGQKLNDGS
ncbi:hypothetical protein HK096_004631 [Nowakowskiella sp. JEL0078]|nr:hypothetical protein HK096_004631 [Nowakowskiella sp. JEL0078]